ncbi:MAG: biotin--[acetyl-CoA-carboxylase] ligase, partial [Bacteroidia bacterium]
QEIENHFLTNLEKYYLLLRQGKTEELDAAYQQALFRKNISGTYTDADGQFEAILIGVKPEGQLLLQDVSGKIREYNFKEIAFN